jgi:hypothetical protein
MSSVACPAYKNVKASCIIGPVESDERGIVKGAIPGKYHSQDDGSCIATAGMPKQTMAYKGKG